MPSMDVFESNLMNIRKVFYLRMLEQEAVEALSYFGWDRYVGLDGAIVAMDSFGASAPANILFDKFGFTVDNVVKAVKVYYK